MNVGGKATTFSYFYGGLRKTKTSGGVTKNYYYDGGRLIAERWSTGAYLLYHYDENSSIYAVTYSSSGSGYAKYYLLKNLQGDVVQILNSTNGVVANYSYDAWGNLLEVTDASGSAITSTTSFANINPIRYRGYYYDSETGFYYLKSRYYDPQNCRFISADTRIDLNCGSTNLNLFAYCGNDPVNNVDPNGTSAAAIYSGIEGIRDWLGSNSTGNPYADAAMKAGAFVLGVGLTIYAFVASDIASESTVTVSPGLQPLKPMPLPTSAPKPKCIDEAVVEAMEKEAVDTRGQRKQAYFTHSPYDFHPRGLVRTEYPGTKNGKIIEWRDPVTKSRIFEWDEDLKYGSHYHAMLIGWGGNHNNGMHYIPGTPVPEPWNSLYFGG